MFHVALQAVFTVLPLRVLRALSCLAGSWRHQSRHSSKPPRLRGDQLYDFICMTTFICSVGFLWTLNAGAIYFWMKDLNQEWLKLQVIYTAVEIFDKVTPCLRFHATPQVSRALCTSDHLVDHNVEAFSLLADSHTPLSAQNTSIEITEVA